MNNHILDERSTTKDVCLTRITNLIYENTILQ